MDAKYFTYINVIDPVIKRMAARGSWMVATLPPPEFFVI